MTNNIVDFASRIALQDEPKTTEISEQVQRIVEFLTENQNEVKSIVACVFLKEPSGETSSNILTTSIVAGDLALSLKLMEASFLERIFIGRMQG